MRHHYSKRISQYASYSFWVSKIAKKKRESPHKEPTVVLAQKARRASASRPDDKEYSIVKKPKRQKSSRSSSTSQNIPNHQNWAQKANAEALKEFLSDPDKRAAPMRTRIDIGKYPIDPAKQGEQFSPYNTHEGERNLRVVGAEESDSQPGKWYAILANGYNELVSDDPSWFYPKGGVGSEGRASKHTQNFAKHSHTLY